MPVTARLVSIPLRIGELAFGATVAGLVGKYLHDNDANDNLPGKRFIYTEVVAGLSILLALLWLIPFADGFIHWPVDLLLFVLWIVAFGLLVDFIGPLNCGSVFAWGDITQQGTCERWKAAVAFTFLSAIFWLASALVGLWFIHRARRGHPVAATSTTTTRRRWGRTSRVGAHTSHV
ncbi:MAG: hypothetical protein M1829_003340 [Trizodia sp. TS-e1964]|nr:MAG: hypothetical protein M1829_003340 [Trizodia sp. TS-e1964]